MRWAREVSCFGSEAEPDHVGAGTAVDAGARLPTATVPSAAALSGPRCQAAGTMGDVQTAACLARRLARVGFSRVEGRDSGAVAERRGAR